MKTPILAAWMTLAAALAARALPAHVYSSSFRTALEFGSELYHTLDSSMEKRLYPEPVCMGPLDRPVMTPFGSQTAEAEPGQVFISAGFIDLLNHLAHAKAVDRVQPGFFRQYARSLCDADASAPPEVTEPRFWTDDVMTEQISYFNQRIGALTAINLSHHSLGHVAKYSSKSSAGPLAPINDLPTPGRMGQECARRRA